jgi:SPP1 family predicted phage head-tail adaptor
MGYNYQIVIQQRTDTADDYGERDATWDTYKTVWAERDDTGGVVSYESDQPVYTDAMIFKIHSYDAPDVSTKMQISYNSQIFKIQSVRKDGRFHLHLVAQAFDDE